MSVTFQLPPSGRNFEVFEAVIVGGKSTRDAAGQFRLSQSRVCQIVRRMQAWQAEVLTSEQHLTDEEQLRLSKDIAGHRLNHLYCEVMGAWRRSQGEFKQTRSSRYGDEVTTTKSSYGDPKYLVAASRLIKAAADLGVAGSLPYPDDDEEPDVGWAVPTEEKEDVVGTAHPTHPVEDCSQNGHARPIPAPAAMNSAAAKAGSEQTSAELSPQHAQARRALLAPVQQDHAAELASAGRVGQASPRAQTHAASTLDPRGSSAGDDRSAVSPALTHPTQGGGIQLQVTPDQPGISSRPLTRQQRRKLQRALRRERA